jgi:Phosphotransferase enzyme family
MHPTLLVNLAALFFPGRPRGELVSLEWFLLKRKGRPLLLLPLPLKYRTVRKGLDLYAAQRRSAKFARWLLPFILGSPLQRSLTRTRVETDTASPLWLFLSAMAGALPKELASPAILCGNQTNGEERFVILGFDSDGHPSVVVKAGLSAAARRIVTREAEVLDSLPAGLVGCLELKGRLDTDALSAFATRYCSGKSPQTDCGIEKILLAWLRSAPTIPFHRLPAGQRLHAACQADPLYRALRTLLDNQPIKFVVCHGDFSPWNVRVSPAGDWTLVDWERCDLQGIPGWDWFHFEIQSSILRFRFDEERIAHRVEALIRSDRFRAYATAAGINQITKPLVLAYLLHQNRVTMPTDGLRVSLRLQDLLGSRWQIV